MTTIDPNLRLTATATVSVAVSPVELERLRTAARLSTMSVSAWGAARVAAALMSSDNRAKVAADAAVVAGEAGTIRDKRASVIFQGDAHADLKRRAADLGLTAHNLVQAALLAAALAEVAGAGPDALAAARTAATRRARAAAAPSTVTAWVPDALLELDQDRLAVTVTALLDAALAKVFEGAGPKIQAGMRAMVKKLPAGERGPLPLAVDPVAVEAVARVLRVDRDVMLTALAIKAAGAL
jgi:hypothetical protein